MLSAKRPRVPSFIEDEMAGIKAVKEDGFVLQSSYLCTVCETNTIASFRHAMCLFDTLYNTHSI